MQKHSIVVLVNDLVKANARFDDASLRGYNALNVTITGGSQNMIYTFEGTGRVKVGVSQFVMETTDDGTLDDIAGDLNELGIPHTVESEDGKMLRVNVLEILKGGFMVHAPANRNTLKATIPGLTIVEFMFRNDGTNLWAEFFVANWNHLSTHTLAQVEIEFVKTAVVYEVL